MPNGIIGYGRRVNGAPKSSVILRSPSLVLKDRLCDEESGLRSFATLKDDFVGSFAALRAFPELVEGMTKG